MDICADTCSRLLQASVPAGCGHCFPKGIAGRMAAELDWSARESGAVTRDSGMNGSALDQSGLCGPAGPTGCRIAL